MRAGAIVVAVLLVAVLLLFYAGAFRSSGKLSREEERDLQDEEQGK